MGQPNLVVVQPNHDDEAVMNGAAGLRGWLVGGWCWKGALQFARQKPNHLSGVPDVAERHSTAVIVGGLHPGALAAQRVNVVIDLRATGGVVVAPCTPASASVQG